MIVIDVNFKYLMNRLTMGVVDSLYASAEYAVVANWPLFLRTVRNVLTRDDFPVAMPPIIKILMFLHSCGGTSLSIFCNSWVFV